VVLVRLTKLLRLLSRLEGGLASMASTGTDSLVPLQAVPLRSM
jgi:hypothetical protein